LTFDHAVKIKLKLAALVDQHLAGIGTKFRRYFPGRNGPLQA
jgi:hypothetical protein